MAVLRDPINLQTPINYIATAAFFAIVACTMLLFKFGGFKATMNVTSKKEDGISRSGISGAYRISRNEFYENGNLSKSSKVITPSMVILPPKSNVGPAVRPAKSTNDIRPDLKLAPMSRSTPDVSRDPRGDQSTSQNVELRKPEKTVKDSKKEEKEKKKLEKQRAAEQKAREKAAQKQAKQQKVKTEKEQAAQAKIKEKKEKKTKKVTPQVPTASNAQNVPKATASKAPTPTRSNVQNVPKGTASKAPATTKAPNVTQTQQQLPVAPRKQQVVSTNTMRSDINMSGGPPPYTELPENLVMKETVNPGNVSFSKPMDKSASDWDMISKHRQEISRPKPATAVNTGNRKQMVMDLQYKTGSDENDQDNSEA